MTPTIMRNAAKQEGFELRRTLPGKGHVEALFRHNATKRYVGVMVRPGATLGWLRQELRATAEIVEAEQAAKLEGAA